MYTPLNYQFIHYVGESDIIMASTVFYNILHKTIILLSYIKLLIML